MTLNNNRDYLNESDPIAVVMGDVDCLKSSSAQPFYTYHEQAFADFCEESETNLDSQITQQAERRRSQKERQAAAEALQRDAEIVAAQAILEASLGGAIDSLVQTEAAHQHASLSASAQTAQMEVASIQHVSKGSAEVQAARSIAQLDSVKASQTMQRSEFIAKQSSETALNAVQASSKQQGVRSVDATQSLGNGEAVQASSSVTSNGATLLNGIETGGSGEINGSGDLNNPLDQGFDHPQQKDESFNERNDFSKHDIEFSVDPKIDQLNSVASSQIKLSTIELKASDQINDSDQMSDGVKPMGSIAKEQQLTKETTKISAQDVNLVKLQQKIESTQSLKLEELSAVLSQLDSSSNHLLINALYNGDITIQQNGSELMVQIGQESPQSVDLSSLTSVIQPEIQQLSDSISRLNSLNVSTEFSGQTTTQVSQQADVLNTLNTSDLQQRVTNIVQLTERLNQLDQTQDIEQFKQLLTQLANEIKQLQTAVSQTVTGLKLLVLGTPMNIQLVNVGEKPVVSTVAGDAKGSVEAVASINTPQLNNDVVADVVQSPVAQLPLAQSSVVSEDPLTSLLISSGEIESDSSVLASVPIGVPVLTRQKAFDRGAQDGGLTLNVNSQSLRLDTSKIKDVHRANAPRAARSKGEGVKHLKASITKVIAANAFAKPIGGLR